MRIWETCGDSWRCTEFWWDVQVRQFQGLRVAAGLGVVPEGVAARVWLQHATMRRFWRRHKDVSFIDRRSIDLCRVGKILPCTIGFLGYWIWQYQNCVTFGVPFISHHLKYLLVIWCRCGSASWWSRVLVVVEGCSHIGMRGCDVLVDL